MKSVYFDKDFVERYQAFLSSKEYTQIHGYSKSPYWEHFSKKVNVKIEGNKITVNGDSGFYIPKKYSFLNNISLLLKKILNNPKYVFGYAIEKALVATGSGHFVTYEKSFDDLMAGKSQTPKSEYLIDFKRLSEEKGCYVSYQDIQKRLPPNSGINNQLIYSYYIHNILNSHVDLSTINTVVEIGAGNGNLLAVLHRNLKNSRFIDIDLSETLSHAIVYISDLFPDASILMPHEVTTENIHHADFVFLTPNQVHLLKDDSVDISLNTFSFQEMTHQQIQIYFELVQRCGKNGSYFLTSNRIEKAPCINLGSKGKYQDPPNRFSEYPWNKNNETLIYEVCPLIHKVQHNDVFIKMERINKKF